MPESGIKSREQMAVVVKAPNQTFPDLVIEGFAHWTVRDLKEHITTLMPIRVAANQQKLVYYGKLLEDSQTLQDALKQNTFGSSHTVHLVVNSSSYEHSATPGLPAASSSPVQTGAITPGFPTVQQVLYHSSNQQLPSPASVPLPLPAGWALNQPSNMTPQQWLWTQLYYQQMQSMQALFQQSMLAGGFGVAATPESFAVPVPAATSEPAAVHVHADYLPGRAPGMAEAAAVPPVGPAAAAPPRDNPLRMNAQGGMDDADGGGENQDALDWLYAAMRGMLLLSILYFYSSFGRFVFVATVGALLWLYRGGFLQQRHRRNAGALRQQPEGPVQQEPPIPAVQGAGGSQQDPAAARDAATDGNDELHARENRSPIVQAAARGRTVLTAAASVIGAFFTTLIPQQPQDVNVN